MNREGENFSRSGLGQTIPGSVGIEAIDENEDLGNRTVDVDGNLFVNVEPVEDLYQSRIAFDGNVVFFRQFDDLIGDIPSPFGGDPRRRIFQWIVLNGGGNGPFFVLFHFAIRLISYQEFKPAGTESIPLSKKVNHIALVPGRISDVVVFHRADIVSNATVHSHDPEPQ